MFEGLVSPTQINFLIVFIEGILSFFSPCIFPLIPVYISFLAGNAKRLDDEGKVIYKRNKVFFHTLCFILGISCAFFILGMSFSAMGTFFYKFRTWFTKIGGILIILLGLFQLGVFKFAFLQKDKRIQLNLTDREVNPSIAFLVGFTFSFGWTPCIGPALSSVLILASAAKSAGLGNLLIVTYTLGFVIPFLLLGLFTTQVLSFLKNKRNLMAYTVKAAGVLLIIIGLMTFTGWMNGISSYLNNLGSNNAPQDTTAQESIKEVETTIEETTTDSEQRATTIPAPDFKLTDQYGNEHTLSDYKGKVVFLNFWATWCGPCKVEMPHIEELYQDYNLNSEDTIFLGVANPRSDAYPRNDDVSKEEVIGFLEENGYTFPVVFDENREVFGNYRITSYPTTFMIDTDGNIFGYVTGSLTKDRMEDIISQTRNHVNK